MESIIHVSLNFESIAKFRQLRAGTSTYKMPIQLAYLGLGHMGQVRAVPYDGHIKLEIMESKSNISHSAGHVQEPCGERKPREAAHHL